MEIDRRRLLQMMPACGLVGVGRAEDAMGALERDAAKILARAGQEMASREAWEAVRVRRRRELQDMLGLDPWPERTPLRARVTGALDRDDHVVEKVAFESIPKFHVTANLYLPKGVKGPAPTIVYVCGHAGPAQGSKVVYQRHGISFARNGYACLIIDPIQIAEVYGLHHGVYGMQMYDWLSRGYAPAGVDTWNAIRGLDYLATRPEVDMERVGMTGRSGGAAMTWFTAALDDRIKVAAPIMGISTYLENIRENTQRLHCDCMFPLNFHRHEMAHQGALIAPRPLLMGHGRLDSLFPVPGYTKFEELMKGLYGSYGHGERFRNIVVETGHLDSDYLREQAIRWFDEHLLGKRDRQPEMAYKNVDAEELAVFGGKGPGDSVNRKVDLVFRPAARVAAPRDKGAWEKRRVELTRVLREKVFAAPMLEGPAAAAKVRGGKGGLGTLVYIVPAGEEEAATVNFFRFAGLPAEARQVWLYPRAHTTRDMLRNAMHVGRTPDSIRVDDVVRAVAGLGDGKVVVAGRGTDAGVALYAAILEPRISGVVLLEPTESHWQGPVMLNALRYTDLPEAAGLVAPRPLHFFRRTPAAYAVTKQIYGVAGAADKIRECYSFEDVFSV